MSTSRCPAAISRTTDGRRQRHLPGHARHQAGQSHRADQTRTATRRSPTRHRAGRRTGSRQLWSRRSRRVAPSTRRDEHAVRQRVGSETRHLAGEARDRLQRIAGAGTLCRIEARYRVRGSDADRRRIPTGRCGDLLWPPSIGRSRSGGVAIDARIASVNLEGLADRPPLADERAAPRSANWNGVALGPLSRRRASNQPWHAAGRRRTVPSVVPAERQITLTGVP